MVDLNEKLSLSKQCILLNINWNSFYFSPKGEGSENLSLMELLKKNIMKLLFRAIARLLFGLNAMALWLMKNEFDA
jgi:putative transposase